MFMYVDNEMRDIVFQIFKVVIITNLGQRQKSA